MKVSLSVDGFKNVDDGLKSIDQALAGALEDIVRTGAFPIENQAKANAPVRTGTLRRSITTEIVESDRQHAVAAIGPHVDYGIYVEFGTRHMRAQPYMRPAFEDRKDEARKTMLDVARDILDEALTNEINTRAGRRLSRIK